MNDHVISHKIKYKGIRRHIAMATVKQLFHTHSLHVVQTAYTQARQWQLPGCTHVTQDESYTHVLTNNYGVPFHLAVMGG